jgi:hypothetical protein
MNINEIVKMKTRTVKEQLKQLDDIKCIKKKVQGYITALTDINNHYEKLTAGTSLPGNILTCIRYIDSLKHESIDKVIAETFIPQPWDITTMANNLEKFFLI